MLLLYVGTGYVLLTVCKLIIDTDFNEHPLYEAVHYTITANDVHEYGGAYNGDNGDDLVKKTRSVLNNIQLVYQCCGVNNYTDYIQSDDERFHVTHVPDSCCITVSPGCAINQTNIHHEGCFPAIKEQFKIAMKAFNSTYVTAIYFFFLLFIVLFCQLFKYFRYLDDRKTFLQMLIEPPRELNETGIEEINEENDDDRENDRGSNADTEETCTVDIENNIEDADEDNALINGVHSNLNENEMSEGSDIDLLIEGELDLDAIEEIIGGETQVKVPTDKSFINPAYQEGRNRGRTGMSIANVESPVQMQSMGNLDIDTERKADIEIHSIL